MGLLDRLKGTFERKSYKEKVREKYEQCLESDGPLSEINEVYVNEAYKTRVKELVAEGIVGAATLVTTTATYFGESLGGIGDLIRANVSEENYQLAGHLTAGYLLGLGIDELITFLRGDRPVIDKLKKEFDLPPKLESTYHRAKDFAMKLFVGPILLHTSSIGLEKMQEEGIFLAGDFNLEDASVTSSGALGYYALKSPFTYRELVNNYLRREYRVKAKYSGKEKESKLEELVKDEPGGSPSK